MELIQQLWFDILNEIKLQGLRDLFELSPYLIWLMLLSMPLKLIAPDDRITCATYVWFMVATGIFLMVGSRSFVSEFHQMYTFEKFVLAAICFGIFATYRFRQRKFVYVTVALSKGKPDGYDNKAN